jgi:hypothetical protein
MSEHANTTDPLTDVDRRPQDPLVERFRPTPADPSASGLTLLGFLADSDRPGYRRLYFSRDLKRSVEFRSESVIAVDDVPADQPPFFGDKATRITLERGAQVEFNQTRTIDELDIDSRVSLTPWLQGDPDDSSACLSQPSDGCPVISRHYYCGPW